VSLQGIAVPLSPFLFSSTILLPWYHRRDNITKPTKETGGERREEKILTTPKNRPEFDSRASLVISKGSPDGTDHRGEPLFVPVVHYKLLLSNNLL